ncbi:hypothetical protein J4E83_009470 [Alternaria metachromatica]|uniref:uncharacterized protein n=1 Tax=Alternaria metachromatica TaxID=283354 RepID=UPI0020C21FCE|nr:uncharacterized protein J4E83_009470 [Alternaria metachromatica]KAI4607574.1 hypothetical protein J4E83_009470 [Alternaria metachromatica]
MNQQDRKRAFGNAFQGASNLSSHPHRKALRSVIASSPASTPQIFYAPTFSFGSDKENEALYLPAQDKFAKPFDGYRHRLQLPPRTSSLRGLSELPVAGHGFEQTYITAHMDIDEGSSSPLNQVLGAYSNEPGPIVFEDPVGGVGPLTPSALHFQTLSLLDPPRRYRPDLTSQSAVDVNAARTSVFTMQSSDLQYCFSEIQKDDVIISFDKGKQVMKLNRYLLCTESRFFAPMLDGPSIEGQTRCIRVRDDFPYAIAAMIQYIQDGIYIFNPNMRLEYENITLLDLHVHAYVVGNKYDVAKLCDHAIGEYINIVGMVLSMGLPSGEDPTDFSHNPEFDHKHIDADPVSSVLNSFLDSLVLVWRNTIDGNDMLRQAILELLKPHINQLMRLKFFQTLMMDLTGFGSDLIGSLAEDGFDVQTWPAMGGVQQRARVKFDTAI